MTASTLRLTVVPFLVLIASSCTLSSQSSGDRLDRSVLERESIASYSTAYEAVQALRSDWLRIRVRTTGSAGDVAVYQDRVRIGGRAELRRLSTQSIASIHYLNSIQASQRYGLGHENGAIVVESRVR